MKVKKCSICKLELELSNFHKNSHNPDGLTYHCKVCQKIKRKEYYEKTREESIRKRIEWRNADEKNRQLDRESHQKWKEQNPESYTTSWKKYNFKKRVKVLEVVGNGMLKCANCGCSDPKFLEINHINGGGGKEQKEVGGRNKFVKSILDGTRSLDDLNILCKVCNSLHYLELNYGSQPYKITWNINE